MSSETPDQSDVADRVERVRVEDEMEQSYIDYAMSVIAGRALPDARDGLKPVHRRILFAMHRAGLTSGAAHRKSSSIVGDTMGDFHPHGDTAIYDTLVRMAQDFSMRYPLVDGQGNFGSMDGDPPAAMRYTEARMSPIAEELLADIGADTVDFESTYDDRNEQPTVLPAGFPNLLVNGASGIAVGMSTSIPPHNIEEIVEAAIHVVRNPDCSVADLIDTSPPDAESNGYVRGPDFPTGATIVGRAGIRSAYETGTGQLRVRSDYEVQRRDGARDRIVITELPYQQNKADLVENIANLVDEGELEGVSDLRDESDRDGVRIVVDLQRSANTDVVENHLLERILERTFSVRMLALIDGEPRMLSLKEALDAYVDHRIEVVRRRTAHDLEEARDRAHILDGRLTALDNADAVVDLVQEAADRDAARAALQEGFDLSDAQAAHVVRMQLGSLTSMERAEVEDEHDSVTDRIERLETILADESELRDVVVDELREIIDTYGDERRTDVVEDMGRVDDEDLIPEAEMLVVVTEDDYVKRMPTDAFDAQHRGGKGIIGADVKEDDRVSAVFRANTHDYLLCFTSQGQVYRLKTYDLPEMSRTARGRSAVNLLDFDDGEEIAAVVPTDELGDGQFVTTVTRDGYVKRTDGDAFDNIFSTGIIATKLADGDELVDVAVTDGSTDLVIATEGGMTIRFDESEVRPMGRSARGVRGIDLADGDRVAGLTATTAGDDRDLLTVTRNGYGKRTPLSEYRTQSRYGKGLVDIDTGDRNGPVAAVRAVEPGDHLVSMSENGQIVRCPAAEVSAVGRNTKGVTVMTVESGDAVADVTVLPADGREDPDESED